MRKPIKHTSGCDTERCWIDSDGVAYHPGLFAGIYVVEPYNDYAEFFYYEAGEWHQQGPRTTVIQHLSSQGFGTFPIKREGEHFHFDWSAQQDLWHQALGLESDIIEVCKYGC